MFFRDGKQNANFVAQAQRNDSDQRQHKGDLGRVIERKSPARNRRPARSTSL